MMLGLVENIRHLYSPQFKEFFFSALDLHESILEEVYEEFSKEIFLTEIPKSLGVSSLLEEKGFLKKHSIFRKVGYIQIFWNKKIWLKNE